MLRVVAEICISKYASHSPIGLLKMHITRCGQETARDAVQVYGGRGITKTGMGKYIELVSMILGQRRSIY